MVNIRFASSVYSYRIVDRVFGTVFQPDSPSSAALAAIEAKLTQAHADSVDRRHQDAIRGYREAQSLVFQQLHPAGSGSVSVVSRDPRLFEPLLSMALEWMNVLPVTRPVAAVRPREPVDPDALGGVVAFDALGLTSNLLGEKGNADAAADWQLSRTLRNGGNQRAAEFFLDRARSTAPQLVQMLDGQQDPGVASAAGFEATHQLGTVFGAGGSRSSEPAVPRVSLPPAVTVERRVGVIVDNEVETVGWDVGAAPPLDAVRERFYEKRADITDLSQIIWRPTQPSDLALALAHYYFYVIPLGLAENHHGLGDFAAAEGEYVQAGSYAHINTAVEAPFVWQRLATLYLDWGNALFLDDNAADALPIYERVITADDTAPAGPLYDLPGLGPVADVARQVIAGIDDPVALDVDPAIAAVVIEVRQQILKIKGGLDYWGFWTNTVPIWTFDYLQSVAISFAQLAVSAERDVINFWDRAGQAGLTRQQIATSAESSDAEVAAADLQVSAAAAELAAYQDGLALATKRAADSRANAAEYATQSNLAVSYAAASSQVSGGDHGDPNELNRLADQLLSGSSIRGSRATISAAAQLAGAKANRQYEIDSLRRQAEQMDLARQQAADEVTAATFRVRAARAAADVARIRARGARQLLDAFDDQFFTPDVWQRMGDTMFRLYRRYLAMALRTARLMQQAYNFETDQNLRLIKPDYTTDEVKGLLGADTLLADIQTFTFDLITATAGKPQPVKQTISLAQRYPFAFENQLRRTGIMEFETGIDDTDSAYPGTYAGRIEAVEVAIDGLVPATGISGTLTNSGISSYRTPLAGWPDPATSGLKHRVQSRETLILSDFETRSDALLVTDDQRRLTIFQGAGVASSWRLEIPKAVNDIDYGALLDVRLTLYYKARFDPGLADRVLSQLNSRPGFTQRQRALPLRWLYPDAFFGFQDSGELRFALRARDFRANETQPTITSVGVLVATDGSIPASGLGVGLATPGHGSVATTTDADGAASSTTAGSPFQGLTGGTAIGDFVINLSAADRDPIVNVVLIMDYSFIPRS